MAHGRAAVRVPFGTRVPRCAAAPPPRPTKRHLTHAASSCCDPPAAPPSFLFQLFCFNCFVSIILFQLFCRASLLPPSSPHAGLPEIACNASDTEFADWCTVAFGAELGAKVPGMYTAANLIQPTPLCRTHHGPTTATAPTWVAAMRAAGDAAITCRVREMLRATQRNGARAWMYTFRATPIYSKNMGDSAELVYMGAFHGAEVPFVFGDLFELESDGERRLSAVMSCAWLNFAESGDPNKGSSGCADAIAEWPEWPPLGGPDGGAALLLANTTGATHGIASMHKTQCDLFMQYP